MITAFLDCLGLPKSCELDRTVPKKMLSYNADLNIADKKALKDDVAKVKWTHVLKPSTINITPYVDSTCEYAEIVILSIEVTQIKRIKRIAIFIHKAIPYPTLLVFGYANQVAISIADKRINQSDKSKWIIEKIWLTPWFNPQEKQGPSQAFVNDFHSSRLPFSTFLAFYKALKDRVIALIAAEHTGRYTLATSEATENRIKHLHQINKLSREMSELKAKLKKTKQIAQQITLNTEIKKHKDAILKLTLAM